MWLELRAQRWMIAPPIVRGPDEMLWLGRAQSRHDKGWTFEERGAPQGSGCVISSYNRHQSRPIVYRLQKRPERHRKLSQRRFLGRGLQGALSVQGSDQKSYFVNWLGGLPDSTGNCAGAFWPRRPISLRQYCGGPWFPNRAQSNCYAQAMRHAVLQPRIRKAPVSRGLSMSLREMLLAGAEALLHIVPNRHKHLLSARKRPAGCLTEN